MFSLRYDPECILPFDIKILDKNNGISIMFSLFSGANFSFTCLFLLQELLLLHYCLMTLLANKYHMLFCNLH